MESKATGCICLQGDGRGKGARVVDNFKAKYCRINRAGNKVCFAVSRKVEIFCCTARCVLNCWHFFFVLPESSLIFIALAEFFTSSVPLLRLRRPMLPASFLCLPIPQFDACISLALAKFDVSLRYMRRQLTILLLFLCLLLVQINQTKKTGQEIAFAQLPLVYLAQTMSEAAQMFQYQPTELYKRGI